MTQQLDPSVSVNKNQRTILQRLSVVSWIVMAREWSWGSFPKKVFLQNMRRLRTKQLFTIQAKTYVQL